MYINFSQIDSVFRPNTSEPDYHSWAMQEAIAYTFGKEVSFMKQVAKIMDRLPSHADKGAEFERLLTAECPLFPYQKWYRESLLKKMQGRYARAAEHRRSIEAKGCPWPADFAIFMETTDLPYGVEVL